MSEVRPTSGWESDFPTFRDASPRSVRERLIAFIADASPEQQRAWSDAIPKLQSEVREITGQLQDSERYSTILEYELPLESRRPDVLLLVGACVVVIELKGKQTASQADIDQVSAYARDLQCYHRECDNRRVIPVLIPTRATGHVGQQEGVHILGPDALDALVSEISRECGGTPVDRQQFLSLEAYRPLPTLVEAARELFESGEVRKVHRASADTEEAVQVISRVAHQAALTKSRHLVLVTGVPGAGKTLVGLRTVHARYLDDLAVQRNGNRPSTPAVFLSGNGPLVEVLQYELRRAGGAGKTFVRGVKEYVKTYSSARNPVPPEHVLVFDEAQRAYDADQVDAKHKSEVKKSEPELFIEFAERIPEWCVIVALIGGGQEIHIGEEGGINQWVGAIRNRPNPEAWTVHGAATQLDVFSEAGIVVTQQSALNLDVELRFHAAKNLHRFVELLLSDGENRSLCTLSSSLARAGLHLRITRDIDVAKNYLRERYADDPDARFGMVASSRDKDLSAFGVRNDFQATKQVRVGPWYGDPEDDYSRRSCRHLEDAVTEFGAQGLELDASLLAWGTDFLRVNGVWSNQSARQYRKGTKVRNPLQLRRNAYRVLLTRGRDACLIFVPPLEIMKETFEYLRTAGFKEL